jgi:hypothetical protein
VKGALGLSVGLFLALGAGGARAETPVGAPPPAPPGASTEAPAPGAAPAPAAGPTVAAPAPQPPTAPATITVGLPQPSVKPINTDIGVGVALTYVSIPLVFISAGVLGVGYLVDSNGAKITGWVMTGTSVALFGVGVGFMVAGSEQGPQPQKSTDQGDMKIQGTAFVVPVVSGSF